MEKLLEFQNLGDDQPSKEDQELLLSLPRVKSWDLPFLYQYQGFWFPSKFFHGVINFQKHFQAKDSDIILATFPKSGATWLKPLTFTIMNRASSTLESSPLLSTFSHNLIPFLEMMIYTRYQTFSVLNDLPTPRILATHVPYTSLPPSIINSNCRIVYLCRNPLDVFISHWHFAPSVRDIPMETPLSLDEAFEIFCQGVQSFGPVWDHELGYWNASLEKSHKILFLKFEDMKENTAFHVKKLADFLGCPFTQDEETKGVIEEISKFYSFENMKKLQVHQTGIQTPTGLQNKNFFRKGKVGDWTNYLTPSMSERFQKLMEEKLGESGLMTTFSQSSEIRKETE
ncbi:hypothetical protein Dsin_000345 [Dipteronia sinensis]|uniref:Sulfotransferase n=1 Tax=Dipteronia sinensis TaxID=43782 RepID=A0AAE0B388_9ROSI|nr:hypothetical protein Dsin_000345 [Dipteronia sinensis]